MRTRRGAGALALGLALLLALPAAQALTWRELDFDGAHYTIAELDLARDPLALYWRDPADGTPYGTLGALAEHERQRGRRLRFATNAGIYAEGQVPLGLTVEEGVEQVPLNRARGGGNFFLQPNGVFAVWGRSHAAVLNSAEYARRRGPLPRLATQSGPMLLIDGRIHPRFQRDSDSLKLRSGVCVPAPGKVSFAISEGLVNFHAFARLFRDALGCRDALYLDGSISQMHLDGRDGLAGADRWRTRPFAALLGVSVPAP